MYEAQVYYNTHTVKKWYFKYIFFENVNNRGLSRIIEVLLSLFAYKKK